MTHSSGPREADVPWPKRTPNVRPGGMVVLRTYAENSGLHDDEVGEDGGTLGEVDWTILAIGLSPSSPAGQPVGLIGEMQVCSNGWHLGVTALMPLGLRGAALKVFRDTGLDGMQPLALWATHFMWDFVATVGRTHAGSISANINIPFATPDPTFVILDRPTEDESQEGVSPGT